MTKINFSFDISPMSHAFASVTIQVCLGLAFDMWGSGAMLGCLWFMAREHTQAEYRWISTFAAGKRANMPWWGGFDWRVWNMASLLDWLVPVLTCSSVYFVISFWPPPTELITNICDQFSRYQ